MWPARGRLSLYRASLSGAPGVRRTASRAPVGSDYRPLNQPASLPEVVPGSHRLAKPAETRLRPRRSKPHHYADAGMTPPPPHVHGKAGVDGSSPSEGFGLRRRCLQDPAVGRPNRQRPSRVATGGHYPMFPRQAPAGSLFKRMRGCLTLRRGLETRNVWWPCQVARAFAAASYDRVWVLPRRPTRPGAVDRSRQRRARVRATQALPGAGPTRFRHRRG